MSFSMSLSYRHPLAKNTKENDVSLFEIQHFTGTKYRRHIVSKKFDFLEYHHNVARPMH